MKQEEIVNQDIVNNERGDTSDLTMTSDIHQDNVINHPPEDLLLCKARTCTSLWTTRVPELNARSHFNTVIAYSLHSYFRDSPWAMPLQLQNWQKSTLPNDECDSYAITAHVHPLSEPVGENNILQPRANGDQNVPQHQSASLSQQQG